MCSRHRQLVSKLSDYSLCREVLLQQHKACHVVSLERVVLFLMHDQIFKSSFRVTFDHVQYEFLVDDMRMM